MYIDYFFEQGVLFEKDMNRSGFINLLKKKGYKHELDGDKIIITHYTNVYLEKVRTLPDNVVFVNHNAVYLNDLESISPGTEFRNKGAVNLMLIKDLPVGVFMNTGSLWTRDFNNIHWGCDIPEVRKGMLLNLIIKRGIV
jgi:hypothetical protein